MCKSILYFEPEPQEGEMPTPGDLTDFKRIVNNQEGRVVGLPKVEDVLDSVQSLIHESSGIIIPTAGHFVLIPEVRQMLSEAINKDGTRVILALSPPINKFPFADYAHRFAADF